MGRPQAAASLTRLTAADSSQGRSASTLFGARLSVGFTKVLVNHPTVEPYLAMATTRASEYLVATFPLLDLRRLDHSRWKVCNRRPHLRSNPRPTQTQHPATGTLLHNSLGSTRAIFDPPSDGRSAAPAISAPRQRPWQAAGCTPSGKGAASSRLSTPSSRRAASTWTAMATSACRATTARGYHVWPGCLACVVRHTSRQPNAWLPPRIRKPPH